MKHAKACRGEWCFCPPGTPTWLAQEPVLGTPGAPVEHISGPSCLAGLGHSEQNWGTELGLHPGFSSSRCPPLRWQLHSDSGTDALCVALIQLHVQALPSPATSQALGGKVVGSIGQLPAVARLPKPGAAHDQTPPPHYAGPAAPGAETLYPDSGHQPVCY